MKILLAVIAFQVMRKLSAKLAEKFPKRKRALWFFGAWSASTAAGILMMKFNEPTLAYTLILMGFLFVFLSLFCGAIFGVVAAAIWPEEEAKEIGTPPEDLLNKNQSR